MTQPATVKLDEERRKGPKDRRNCAEDRRNAERNADDFAPRRNPETPTRRNP
ncbi:MAG: hypothetical protein V3R27_11460 [Pseudomonadales bacterium]